MTALLVVQDHGLGRDYVCAVEGDRGGTVQPVTLLEEGADPLAESRIVGAGDQSVAQGLVVAHFISVGRT